MDLTCRAAYGRDIDSSLLGAAPGTLTGGKKAELTGDVLGYAQQIADNEVAHVRFLRQALGSSAVDRPALNIGEALNFTREGYCETHNLSGIFCTCV